MYWNDGCFSIERSISILDVHFLKMNGFKEHTLIKSIRFLYTFIWECRQYLRIFILDLNLKKNYTEVYFKSTYQFCDTLIYQYVNINFINRFN